VTCRCTAPPRSGSARHGRSWPHSTCSLAVQVRRPWAIRGEAAARIEHGLVEGPVGVARQTALAAARRRPRARAARRRKCGKPFCPSSVSLTRSVIFQRLARRGHDLGPPPVALVQCRLRRAPVARVVTTLSSTYALRWKPKVSRVPAVREVPPTAVYVACAPACSSRPVRRVTVPGRGPRPRDRGCSPAARL